MRPGQTVGPSFTLYGTGDVFLHKEVPFEGYNDRWRHLGKMCPQNPVKVSMKRQFRAKMPIYQNSTLSKTVTPIKPKFEDKAETTTCTSWVSYHYPKLNQMQRGWLSCSEKRRRVISEVLYWVLVSVSHIEDCAKSQILAQFAELFISAGQMLSVCVCVWMLSRVAQIITAVHRDFCMHRPTNEAWLHTKN